MRIDISQLREFALNGALLGAFVGIVGAMFCALSSPLLTEFDFLLGSVVQSIMQLCIGGVYGIVIGGLTLSMSVPKWKSEGASILQCFLAPTALIVLIAVCVFSFEHTLPPFSNVVFYSPLAAFMAFWTPLCIFISVVAGLASLGSLGD